MDTNVTPAELSTKVKKIRQTESPVNHFFARNSNMKYKCIDCEAITAGPNDEGEADGLICGKCWGQMLVPIPTINPEDEPKLFFKKVICTVQPVRTTKPVDKEIDFEIEARACGNDGVIEIRTRDMLGEDYILLGLKEIKEIVKAAEKYGVTEE